MITTVGTPMDVTDHGALPQTQIHTGSTATSKFVVRMSACLFVCGKIDHSYACQVKICL